MPSWSTPITAGTDIYTSAMIQMFQGALDERRNVSEGKPAGYSWVAVPPLPDPSSAPGTSSQYLLIGFQGLLTSQVIPFGNWLDYTAVSLEGAVDLSSLTGFQPATYPLMRQLAGLPPITIYKGGTTTAQTIQTVLSSSLPLFRRQRPREILSTTCTRDVHGNPVFDGMKAYLVGDALAPDNSGSLGDTRWGHGTCWKYSSATGTWTRTLEHPDIVDNTLAPPYVLAEQSTDANMADTYPYSGQAQHGDYITAMQWEELRKLIDILRWSRYDASYGNAFPSFWNINSTYKSFVVGGGNPAYYYTYNDAKNAAIAAWTTTATHNLNGGSPQAIWESSNEGYYAGVNHGYAVQIVRYAVQYQITGLSTIKKNVYFYVEAALDGDGSIGITYDANGDNVVQDKYHLFGSTLGDTSAAPSSPALGSITMPNDAGDPGGGFSGGTALERGYHINGATSVCKWNVAGGFNYCTVTDV